MSARAPVAAAAALLLAACNQSSAPPAPAAPAIAVAATPAPSPATNQATRLRGQALMGKDGYGIVPCGESAQRILEVAPEAQAFLDKYLESGAREFFVEAIGEPLANGHVRVRQFDRLYTEGPGCGAELEGFAFAAYGNEPFWAVIDGNGGLRLERPGEAPLVAPGASLAEQADGWFGEGDTSAGRLSLRLAPGFCSDGMSDGLYAWNATVRLGEQEFHGCAFRGLGKTPI